MDASRRWPDLLAIGGIGLALLLLGAFCVHLEHIFYLTYGPFWDSVSYDNLLARVMLAVRAGRPFDAFAMIYGSTVALPWLQAMLLAPFVEPSRAVAIWLQIFWAFVTALAAYAYFRRVAGYGALAAAGSALMFFTIAGSFAVNGGLPDFRLDYLQYMLFGLASLLYLIARAEQRPGFWFLWGLGLGLACLGRATTPVYAVLVYSPFLLADLWQQRRAVRQVLLQYGLAALACLASCGWYLVSNYDHLHFYYFVLSWDSNAALPLSQSIRHALFVLRDIGPVAAAACVVLLGLNIAAGPRGAGWNWRALWCGVAPLGFLILHGAGLNDQFSELSVFGFVLFALHPRSAAAASPRLGSARAAAVTLAVVASAAYGAYEGYNAHAAEPGAYPPTSIPPHHVLAEVTGCMIDDIEHGPPGLRRFALLYIGVLNSEEIVNFLFFDDHRPATANPSGLLSIGIDGSELTSVPLRLDKLVTPAHWDLIPGADDQQKTEFLAQQEAANADYVIVPTRDAGLSMGVIDQHSLAIAAALAKLTTLRPLCTIATGGPENAVTIYRTESRQAASPPG